MKISDDYYSTPLMTILSALRAAPLCFPQTTFSPLALYVHLSPSSFVQIYGIEHDIHRVNEIK